MEPLLELRHVKKYFPVSGGKMLHAVDDVSFSIPKGATLGLVGESGCGKSTLGRVCIRLLEATEGEILFEGTDIRKLRRSQMHKKRADMQMIFQDPLACLNARRNVYELISEPLTLNPDYWRKLSKEDVTKKVIDLMDIVGLSKRFINSYPHELDGGRRQRIAEQLVGGCFFHTLPQVHHSDFAGNMLYNRKIVGNEEIGQTQLLLQIHQQI